MNAPGESLHSLQESNQGLKPCRAHCVLAGRHKVKKNFRNSKASTFKSQHTMWERFRPRLWSFEFEF